MRQGLAAAKYCWWKTKLCKPNLAGLTLQCDSLNTNSFFCYFTFLARVFVCVQNPTRLSMGQRRHCLPSVSQIAFINSLSAVHSPLRRKAQPAAYQTEGTATISSSTDSQVRCIIGGSQFELKLFFFSQVFGRPSMRWIKMKVASGTLWLLLP